MFPMFPAGTSGRAQPESLLGSVKNWIDILGPGVHTSIFVIYPHCTLVPRSAWEWGYLHCSLIPRPHPSFLMRLPTINLDATSGVAVIHPWKSQMCAMSTTSDTSPCPLSLQATRPKPHSRAMRALSAGAVSRKLREKGRAKNTTAGRAPREPG